jgi:hypothetical protein
MRTCIRASLQAAAQPNQRMTLEGYTIKEIFERPRMFY